MGLVAFGWLCAASGAAHADANRVKGPIGGAMIGAEVVMLTESAFRLRPTWMYLAGGAGGGLLGGYVGNRMSGSTNRPPAFLLAGGIALIIPTIMGVLTATQYEPSGPLERDTDDDDDTDDDEKADMRLELPRVGLAQTFSREDLARFRVRQVSELHLTFLRGAF